MKTALITGVTEQDGAYLSEFLLEKGYIVHGFMRRASRVNTDRGDHLYQDPHLENRNFIFHFVDMTTSSSLIGLVKEIQPDEIYNLGAMSHVQVSFETSETSENTAGLGTLIILEVIRLFSKRKGNSNRHLHLNYTEKYRRFHKWQSLLLYSKSLYENQNICIVDNG